jgi:hypothetical protein
MLNLSPHSVTNFKTLIRKNVLDTIIGWKN